MKFTLLSLGLLFAFAVNISAQSNSELGFPLITNYSQKTYKGHQQVWSVIQDDRGVMYFGTSSGITEYDGVNWRQIKIPGVSGVSIVRAMEKGKDGKVYYGSARNFGYLQTNARGETIAVSLGDLFPKQYLDFTNIQAVKVIDQHVYFLAREFIFRTEVGESKPDRSIKAWKPETYFTTCLDVDGELFIHEMDRGLFKIKNDQLELIPGTEVLKSTVRFLLPLHEGPSDKKEYLVGTSTNGFFKYNGERTIPFKTEIDNALRGSLVYRGIKSPDGNFLISVIGQGVKVINVQGELIQSLDFESGLQDESVYSIYLDNSEIIWLGLDNGIAKVESSNSVTSFSAQAGLKSGILSIERVGNTLIAGTSTGIFTLNSQKRLFEPLPNAEAIQVFALLNEGQSLIAPISDGIGFFAPNEFKSIKDIRLRALSLLKTKSSEERIYVGSSFGLSVLKRNKTGEKSDWQLEGYFKDINQGIWFLSESAEGNIWAGTQEGLVYRVVPFWGKEGELDFDNSKIEKYDGEKGLKNSIGLIYAVSGKIYSLTETGLIVYNPESNQFEADSTFGEININFSSTDNFTLKEDALGRVWISINNKIRLATPKPDGGYHLEDNLFNAYPWEDITTIYPEQNGVVWIGSGDGLIRMDEKAFQKMERDFRVLLRQVRTDRDTLYIDEEKPTLKSINNSLKFQYAAPFFEQEDRILYQTYLEGFDGDWSLWNRNSFREYTNLSAGTYTFRIRAKNLHDTISEEASFTFTILPPWYATWWAYVIYALLLGGIITAIVKWRSRKLKAENQVLEEKVKERTAELELSYHNVELLGEIGRKITASLSAEKIISTVYANVNALMEASILGIGIYQEETQTLDFPSTYENGAPLAPYSNSLQDPNRLAALCFNTGNEIVINDLNAEYGRYLQKMPTPSGGEVPVSLIYLPLKVKGKLFGVITVQSFTKNAFSDYHLYMLRTIAVYTAIALENAESFQNLQQTLSSLKATQSQLIQSEKMASLGELTAGIAHEIQNPLNFVNNFSEVSEEMLQELIEELENGDVNEAKTISEDLIQNLSKIKHHGKRADSIVKGMLQHSRSGSIQKEPTNLNTLADEYLRLAYHGLRAKDKSFQSDYNADLDPNLPLVNVMPQDISRVLLNLINNAFYAVNEKRLKHLDNGNEAYKPMVTVKTQNLGSNIMISVSDNGGGIPESVKSKIFQPFFTTKPTGQGTGLGLSLSYDIVKAHGGELKVESQESEGSQFSILLPLS